MDLRTKLGQMICMGYPGAYPDEAFYEMVEKYKVGNATLFRCNFATAQQSKDALSQLSARVEAATGFPPLLSVDQEGGMVTRFSKDFTHFPGAMATAATGDAANAFQMGYCTGVEMRAVGANFDLAPCVDINTNPANPVIGVRAYGDTVDKVEKYAFAMADGLEQAGVAAMIKHFPGHGDTHQDSHFSLPVVEKTLDELMKVELLPYIHAIGRGIPAIMTSHIVYPLLDPTGVPATMSHAIMTGLLRNKLGFNGIVRSDDLEMDAIKKFYGVVKGAVMALKAGVDIISISHTPSLVAEFVEEVERELAAGTLDPQLIEDAFARITRCKQIYCAKSSYSLSDVGCAKHRALAKKISEDSITLIRDERQQLPLSKGKTVVVGTYAFNQTNVNNPLLLELSFADIIAQEVGGVPFTISNKPTEADVAIVMRSIAEADTVVFGTYNAHLVPEQAALANAVAAKHPNVIFATMRNPYDQLVLDKHCAQVACYEYTEVSLNTLAAVLKGSLKASGTLPVQIL